MNSTIPAPTAAVTDLRARRRLSRALTDLSCASAEAILAGRGGEADRRGSAWRIGITGPPGVGKSTLIGRLAGHRLARGAAAGLAVLAIDPTSPLTGGSILGDRVRMDAAAADPRLFIRSLPSRGNHDGLSDNLPDLIDAVEAAGFPELIVETVGVGQVEYAVRTLTDTVVLILHPEAGDSVQAMKAGILEVADVYVVNKADLPGAARTAAEITAMLARAVARPGDWTPPVILCAASDPAGIAALDAAIDRHRAWVTEHRDADAVRRARTRYHAQALLARRVADLLDAAGPALLDRPLAALCADLAARLLPARLLPAGGGTGSSGLGRPPD